jgi:hypothetical protein
MMIREAVKGKLSAVSELNSDDILSALGLARKRLREDARLLGAGIFLVGTALGAGLALLMDPKSVGQRRRVIMIKDRTTDFAERIAAAAGTRAHATNGSNSPKNGTPSR